MHGTMNIKYIFDIILLMYLKHNGISSTKIIQCLRTCQVLTGFFHKEMTYNFFFNFLILWS